MISEELLQSFIAEASDLLDDVEPSLVEYSRLDDIEERMEIVNRVFRHFHSIKGSAGFVGLHNIARLTHEAETLLEQFRKSPDKVIPQENIALLYRTVDLLRAIFDSGGDPESEENEDSRIDALIDEISKATKSIKSRAVKGYSALNISADLAHAAETEVESPKTTQVVSLPSGGKMNAGATPSDAEPTEAETPAAGTETRSPTRSTEIRQRPTSEPKATDGKTGGVPTSISDRNRSDSVTRSRHPSSDTARIIHTSKMTKPDKMTTSEFAGRYVSEANELLEQTEQALLQAEQHPESSNDAVQEALRCLHSFKGNSGLMNLTDLERLSHRMETEVENNIGRSLGLDSQTFDVLLQMIDILRQGVLDFSCGGSGSIPEADAYIAMMDEYSFRPNTDTNIRPPKNNTSVNHAKADPEKTAFPPSPPPEDKIPQKKETDTRELKQEVKPQRQSTDTTRLVLRGNTSAQEDLRSIPKADTINIMSDTDTQPPPPMTTSSGPATPSAVNKTKETERHHKAPDKTSDTGQKRRTAEQLAARNDIRVDLRKLDAMLDLVGELVIAEAMVTRHPVVWNAENESLERAVHQLRRVASSLQDMATSVRMIPLAPTFRRMTRLVYDLSVKAGKQVDLILLGEETEVDRTVIERISDPLVHIIRNAIDHGIEPPEERLAIGKPETGRLTIEGHHEGGEVWIVITDDGRGLDREAILQRAITRGLIQGDGSDLSDNQIYHFIFEPGFSTATKVTDISGRGFGMDVVKKNIEKLSGKIDIRTRPGEGTAVVMRIPLTLAIIEGMLVRSGTTRYIIPLLSIRESLRPELSQIFSTPDGQQVVKLRDELIPIVKLDETFNRTEGTRDLMEGILMIVEGEDGEVVALFADELLGQQETVIKGLSGWLKKSRGVSGCTILGDGEVGLILDIGAIVRLARQRSSA